MLSTTEIYLKLQRAYIMLTGLKRDDFARIVYEPVSKQFGWTGYFNDFAMQEDIGSTHVVKRFWDTTGVAGIALDTGCHYPFFALEIEGMNMEAKRALYNKLEEGWLTLSGLSYGIGDKVKIVNKAERNDFGWNNSWTGAMAEIGEEQTIRNFNFLERSNGITLEDGYSYPFFCLERA